MLNNQPGNVADGLAAAAPSTRQPGSLVQFAWLHTGLDQLLVSAFPKDMAEPYSSVPLVQLITAQHELLVYDLCVHIQACQEQRLCQTRVTRRG